jgi:hypothetical protein
LVIGLLGLVVAVNELSVKLALLQADNEGQSQQSLVTRDANGEFQALSADCSPNFQLLVDEMVEEKAFVFHIEDFVEVEPK